MVYMSINIVYTDLIACEQTGHLITLDRLSSNRSRKAVQNAFHISYKPSLLNAKCKK